jgi:sugar-specific transcriptional regulator TrmB
MINDDYIQTLMDFGLSFLQSKVYLTIVKLQKANIKTISRASTIARQDIYRIMPALLQKGLVEKIVTRPTTYNATPLELGISILLEKKKDECIDLEKKQVWLLKNFNSSKPNRNSLEDSTNFKITSEITLLLKMHKELIQKATETIDAVIPFIPSTSDIS